MKDRSPILFVEDIISSMDKIESYIEGMSFEDFDQDELVVDAVIRNLEVIGEASRHLPETLQNGHPDIPWKRMIGLRNIMIHAYFGVDRSIVWKIVTENLPETKGALEALLSDLKK